MINEILDSFTGNRSLTNDRPEGHQTKLVKVIGIADDPGLHAISLAKPDLPDDAGDHIQGSGVQKLVEF